MVKAAHADHAGQVKQIQIKHKKCRSNRSFEKNAYQTDQIVYYSFEW